MNKKKIPDYIKDKVNDWLGDNSILHFWEQDLTFFVVSKIADDGDICKCPFCQVYDFLEENK